MVVCTNQKVCTCTSKTIQNDIIESIREVLLTQVLSQFKTKPDTPFAIIAAEVTDTIENREVFAVCITFVDHSKGEPKIKEAFLDFVDLQRTTGQAIANGIIKALLNAGLSIKFIRGQAYDGASSMSSNRIGVQKIIKEMVNERAQYVGPPTNLSILHMSGMQDTRDQHLIGLINDVYLFFSNSPKRQRFFENILNIISADTKRTKLKGLCKTRWVERHECLENFCEMLPIF